MSLGNGQYSELTELLEALCDDRLSPAETVRLEQLVLADNGARRLYLEYIDLHGFRFTVLAMDERRIARVAVEPLEAAVPAVSAE